MIHRCIMGTLWLSLLPLAQGCDPGPTEPSERCAQLCAPHATCGPEPLQGACAPPEPQQACLETCGAALEQLEPDDREQLDACSTCVTQDAAGSCDVVDHAVALHNTCSHTCTSPQIVRLLDDLAFGWGDLVEAPICEQHTDKLRACCVSLGLATANELERCDTPADTCAAGCVIDAPCGALDGSDPSAAAIYAGCVADCGATGLR